MKKIRGKYSTDDPQPGCNNIQMVGSVYNHLTIIKYSHNNKNQNKVWECLCSCGKTTFGTTTQIRQGKKTSCGCKQYRKGKYVYNYNGYKDISGTRWYGIKANAASRDLDFEITKEQIWEIYNENKGLCKLSGLPISFKDSSASVDRVDSKKGYVLGNVQVIHKDINVMKSNLDENYFIEMCRLIANNS